MSVQLAAEPRIDLGKQNMKRLRASGRIPGVLYGAGVEGSLAISLNAKDAEHIVKANGKSAIYDLALNGRTFSTKLKEVQLEPLRKGLVHLDFFVEKAGA